MPRGTDVSEMKRTYRTAVADEFPDKLNITLLKETGLRRLLLLFDKFF